MPRPTPVPDAPPPRLAAATATPAPGHAQFQQALATQKGGFDQCAEAALAASGGPSLAGRKIGLLVAVVGTGRVEAAQVEEPDVEASALGACLRRVAGKLRFQPFTGDPVGLRIPLRLGADSAQPR